MSQRKKAAKEAQEAEAMLARDNLKIKMMARYKALKQGQIQAFLDIENELTDLAQCKG